MKRNLCLYGSGALAASILLAVLTLPFLEKAPDADETSNAKGFETPQAVVAIYSRALTRKDWRTCYLCCDPKMRGDCLIRLFYAATISQDAELAAIIKKHQKNETTMSDWRRNNGAPKELVAYEAIQKEFEDLPRFVDEMCRRLDAVGQETFRHYGDAREISILGDKAIGYWTPPPVKSIDAVNQKARSTEGRQPESFSNRREPFHFRKIGGKWYMTIADPPPPLSVSERARLLKAEVQSLFVYLACSTSITAVEDAKKSGTYQSLGGKKYGELRMGVRPVAGNNDPTVHVAQLTEAQAKELIDYLAAEGYVGQAVELGKQDVPRGDPGAKLLYPPGFDSESAIARRPRLGAGDAEAARRVARGVGR